MKKAKHKNVTKIDFITMSGNKISVDSEVIDEFFEFLKNVSIKNMLIFSLKRFNKVRMCKILLPACFKKLFGTKLKILESMWLTLLSPIKELKEISGIEVHIENRILRFDLNNHDLSELVWTIGQVMHHNQYSVEEKNIKNKIVVDAGANAGVFSIFAVFMGAKKVYSFEPVPDTIKILSENIRLNKMEDKITIVNNALGDKNYFSTISFNFSGDGSSVVDSVSSDRKSEKIEVIKLDDFLSENKIKKIDFIKMDVEGFEERVLIGAKKTIEKSKPILSLSAYHRLDDKERLPKVIRSLREDYKIVLNRFHEEDFYCY